MPHSIKRARLLFFASIVMLVTQHPVIGLETNETVTDDFDTGTANFWQWFSGDEQPGQDLTTLWHLSMHGDSPPYGIEVVRPPMEENGGGFLEIVPFSDSPAQIISNVFDLLPGATVEMTYWNIVPFPILERNTVLNLYIEFLNINQSDDSIEEPPLRTVQVFKAPFPTDPSPGWTSVNIDLLITEPSKVQLRIDGIRRNLTTTGLAVSKVTINNGLDVSTTTTSTTSTTMPSTTVASTVDSSTPTPTKYAVDKTTATTTTTTNAPTTNEFTTLDSSDSFSTTDESTTVSELVPSSSSSSSTSISSTTSTTPVATVSPTTSIFTVIKPGMNASSSTLSSISSTTTTPTTVLSTTSASTIVPTTSTSTIASTTSTSTIASTTSTSTIASTTSTTMSSTLSTSSTTSIITSSTDSGVASTTPQPQPGMTTNQLRDVLIGVGVSILLFFLFCLLFTLCYRRHRRRRAYLIENRQLESGIIRALELSDQIPYSPYKSESDSSSNTSTTASNRSLAPNLRAQLSIRRLFDNWRLKTNKNSSKITPLN